MGTTEQAGEEVATEPGVKLCRLCGLRHVSPSRLAVRDFRCTRCRGDSPAYQAAYARYRQSERGKAVSRALHAVKNKRRIWIGRQYHSVADTPERASMINGHIKDRRRHAKQGQQNREKTQGAAAG